MFLDCTEGTEAKRRKPSEGAESSDQWNHGPVKRLTNRAGMLLKSCAMEQATRGFSHRHSSRPGLYVSCLTGRCIPPSHEIRRVQTDGPGRGGIPLGWEKTNKTNPIGLSSDESISYMDSSVNKPNRSILHIINRIGRNSGCFLEKINADDPSRIGGRSRRCDEGAFLGPPTERRPCQAVLPNWWTAKAGWRVLWPSGEAAQPHPQG